MSAIRTVEAAAAALVLVATGSARAQCEVATFDDDAAPAGAAFGNNVAIEGGVLLVGQSDFPPSDGTLPDAAYVHRFDGTTWALEQELVAQGVEPSDQFSCSLAISGDVLIASACRDDIDDVHDAGSAYVFRYDGTTWIEEQKLVAPAPKTDGLFGVWVALAGDVALILELDDESLSGEVYAYRYNGTTWALETTLVPAARAPGDGYGYPVSLSPCGRVAVIGAPYDPHAGQYSGAAYVFRHDGVAWAEEARLTAGDASERMYFGIGASVDRDTIVVGGFGGNTNAGAAYVFRFDGKAWPETAKLTSAAQDPLDWFGHHVRVSGDVIAVSAEGTYESEEPGAVHVFRRAGGTWHDIARLEASDPSAGDWFGNGIALEGDHLAASAAFNDRINTNAGAAFVFAGLTGVDYDGNGVADVCDRLCPADTNGDGDVDFNDILRILADWGSCP